MLASLAQSASQPSPSVQHGVSMPHTHSWHEVSLQPGAGSCAEQQSPVPAQEQLSLHSTLASSVQVWSHRLSQHSWSMVHTHELQVVSSQLGPPCAVQQSPPGVAAGVGVWVCGGRHGQLAEQSVEASSTQVSSQQNPSASQVKLIPQQCPSSPHTQA